MPGTLGGQVVNAAPIGLLPAQAAAANAAAVSGQANGALVTVQDEGTDLTLRTVVNYVGSGVTASDDATNERTLVTVNAPKSTVSAGLPGFGGRLAGDLHYDTAAATEYVLTGTAGATRSSTFSFADGSLANQTNPDGSQWLGDANTFGDLTVVSGKAVIAATNSERGNKLAITGSASTTRMQTSVIVQASDVGAYNHVCYIRFHQDLLFYFSFGRVTPSVSVQGNGAASTLSVSAAAHNVTVPQLVEVEWNPTTGIASISVTNTVSGVKSSHSASVTPASNNSGFVHLRGYSELANSLSLDDFSYLDPGTLAWNPVVPTGLAYGTVAAKTSAYTMVAADDVILASGTFTVTLPAASSKKRLTVKNTGTGTITVAPASGTIDGAANRTLTTQYSSVDVVADGTNWFVT